MWTLYEISGLELRNLIHLIKRIELLLTYIVLYTCLVKTWTENARWVLGRGVNADAVISNICIHKMRLSLLDFRIYTSII
jgi:hypothetical protein